MLPESLTEPPPGYALSARDAVAIADQTSEVQRERARHPDLRGTAYIPTYFPDNRWLVHYVGDRRDLAQVHVNGVTGEVIEAWTGVQVRWIMARGYEGQFGEKLNAPYVWLSFAVLFLLPFIDPRRPFRMLHLDLAVLLSFGISQAFFNAADIDTSVPLAYLPLGYLLVRMLMLGLRPRTDDGPLVPWMKRSWLVAGLVLLVVARVGLNVADSDVVDVGYAGVVGADRIVHGEELYVDNRYHPDAYGPLNYLAYVPFEAVFPFSGEWDDLPAAHAAAIVFDLLTLFGLLLLGRVLRAGREGSTLGLALAFAWVAYPFSALPLMSNTNDSLVAALVVWSLVAIGSPLGRGALVGLGAAAKFAPAVLLPLLARGVEPLNRRRAGLAVAAFAVVVLVAFLPFWPQGGARELWDTTIGYQAGRDSPFSIWGQYESLEWLLSVVKVAVVAFALSLLWRPRERDAGQVVALAAAVLIALQFAATHWFYLYIPWFAPLVLAALFVRSQMVETDRSEPAPKRAPVAIS